MDANDVMAVSIFVFVAAAAVFVALVLPLWIVFHYVSKSRSGRGLAAQDEKLLADVWDAARRMEDRLVNLERIFGSEHPRASAFQVGGGNG